MKNNLIKLFTLLVSAAVIFSVYPSTGFSIGSDHKNQATDLVIDYEAGESESSLQYEFL